MKKLKFVFLTLLIVLTAVANLQAAISYSPPSPRTGETVTFTLSPSGAPMGAISWNFGDGTPVQSGSLTITHAYAAVGSYTASASYITLNSAIPKVDQATVTVTNPRQITFSPPQPKAGQAVAFTAQNFFSACIRWDFGDATIKNGAAAESHAYANAGSYTVRAYDECGGSYGAETMVTVAKTEEEPPPTPTPTPTAPSFAVSIVSLYFAGGNADVSVAKDAAGLQAFADIQVTGTGILQWQWLVDGMAVKADTLAASFSSKYSLDSGKVPGLPTAIPGRHLVTLRFQNPKTDFTIPVITYFVGLRGPAPVVRNVTPQTLAPGAEYNLELEGAELTPGTEISFPAPLALVKKPVILTPTTAQATVFVPITAGNGVKAITAKNEYGRSDGPGQILIASSPKSPSSSAPGFKEAPKPSPEDLMNKRPAISGTIQCVPQFTKSGVDYYAMAWIFLTKGSQPISGAVVKVDGTVIPPFANPAGGYKGYAPKMVKVGRGFKVEVTIAGVTYTGSGGRVDNIVNLTKPARGETWRFKQDGPLDCRWTFSNGVSTVNLHAQLESSSGALLNVIYDKNMAADHASIPVPVISDPKGRVFITLTRRFSDIQLEGEWAPGSKIEVSQFYGYGFKLSEAVFGKDSTPQPSAPPTPGAGGNPPLQANVPQPANPAPPAVFCADIAVTGIKATLVSTQVGDPSVDFPHDKIKLQVTLENVGNKAVPSDFLMDIFIKKNSEKVDGRGYPIWTTSLGAPGSRFVIDDIVDSFPHGAATTYSVEILPLYNECATENNNASLTIDETQLHPGGVPDLTLSIFMVEKRWHQEGDQFKGTCYFSADVANVGSGYCDDGSRTVDLEFIRVAGNRMLAFIHIPENELPGPGSKKRFSVEVPDSQEPPGETPVVAFINPAHNETKKDNNWATNGATLNNDLESPLKSSARISFAPWGMTGRIFYIRPEIRNLKQQPLQNLRLILLKNGTKIKEWKSLALAAGGSSGNSLHVVEDRPEIESDTTQDEYRAILTTNSTDESPAENTILDSKTKLLQWMDMDNSIVQALLQDPIGGIGAQMEKADNNIRIYSNKTKTKISPEHFYISIEGKKKKWGAWHEFQASVWLKVHARNGQIAAEVIDKKLTLGSEAEKILIAIFLPGIGYGIQHGIEKAFMSAIPNNLGIGGLLVSPCGIVLRDGALCLYHPY